MTAANRGKKAERLLHTYMQKLSEFSNSACIRLPDAAAGSRVATLCDFLYMREGVLHLIECKSTRHAYRLPHGNVDAGQVSRMRLWKFAGARAFVMIYHELEDVWRSASADFFLTREGGSWDLRHIPTSTIETAFYNYANPNRT